ncbi:FtsB family cell division protein [Sinanaerobacter chloroacetimidivorans]|jgi:cell division protein DivIC|uniref:Septum formation initiator family protein n=1 Tax=Sinanaerobacter chloroacetimidivorans TaxID=2818044 RepID=A0A8J7W2Z5_9FIRM|nr:septum formation initiator family protein [Sinanaerobacter chloroacetimidivorans]MBR0598320.1 septum formation initiator family protein [Sinanaerobacter chloroacetimidivorans]
MFKRKKRRSKVYKNSSQVIDIEEARKGRKLKREAAIEKKNKVKKTKAVVTERQAGKKARRRMIYFAVFLVIIGLISASAINIVTLKINEAKALEEQQALLKQKERLETELSQINSPEYIEQQARQQLRMVKPGEILYVLPDKTKKTTSQGIVPE